MGSYMAMASVLLSPRLQGSNTPLKIYTYMAAGKPIVATSILSHTQVLSDVSAYLAPPSVDEFSLALCAALETNVEALTARQNRTATALKLIETRYNRRIFAQAIANLYSELLSSSPQKTSGGSK
jgi:glycosyltransferase involved in cell wall biosynthesis